MSGKNYRRKRKGSQPRRKGNRSVSLQNFSPLISFKDLFQYTFSASTAMQTTSVAPGSFTRLQTIGEMFQYYRFETLSLKIFPFTDTASGTNNIICVSYQPRESGVADLNTFVQLTEVISSTLINQGKTTPSSLRVARAVMRNSDQRRFAVSTSATLQESVQGNIHIIPSQILSSVISIQISGTCRFWGPTPSQGKDRPRLESPTPCPLTAEEEQTLQRLLSKRASEGKST